MSLPLLSGGVGHGSRDIIRPIICRLSLLYFEENLGELFEWRTIGNSFFCCCRPTKRNFAIHMPGQQIIFQF